MPGRLLHRDSDLMTPRRAGIDFGSSPGMMEIRTSHQADREITQCTRPRWSMAQLYQERTADLE